MGDMKPTSLGKFGRMVARVMKALPEEFYPYLEKRLGPARQAEAPLEPCHHNLAASMQAALEEVLAAHWAAMAKKTGRCAHHLLLEAIERHADREEAIEAFVKEALAAEADIDKTGEVYRAEDVHAWIDRMARGEKASRPKPWRA